MVVYVLLHLFNMAVFGVPNSTTCGSYCMFTIKHCLLSQETVSPLNKGKLEEKCKSMKVYYDVTLKCMKNVLFCDINIHTIRTYTLFSYPIVHPT